MHDPLLCLLGDNLGLCGAKTSADGAGLLRSEVERRVLLGLVEKAELLALGCVDDGESAGDRLADVVAVEGRD